MSVFSATADATETIALLHSALRRAWSADTSSDPEVWTPANPAWGQCAVSALVIQDHLGGVLLRCQGSAGSHYFNGLPDGSRLDTTQEQFRRGYVHRHVEMRERDYVLGFQATRRRYDRLKRAVDVALRAAEEHEHASIH